MDKKLEKQVCKKLGLPIGCSFEVKHCNHENQNKYVDMDYVVVRMIQKK